MEIVTGREVIPNGSTADELEKYSERERMAIAEIMLNIEPTQFSSVAILETPKAVWDSLKTRHRSHCKDSQAELRRKLLWMKKRDGQSLQEFVSNICDMENKTALKNYIMSKENKIFAILEGLPPEYDVINTVLE